MTGRRPRRIASLWLGVLGSLVLGWGIASSPLNAAEPTSLFDSTLCRLLGCAVVYNGEQWQLYVVTGESGRPARLWATSDGQADITTIEGDRRTGTGLPGRHQGSSLGVDLDGDDVADLLVDVAADGFLDAGAALPAFPLTATSELSLARRELQHSFYVAANVPLAIHGEARWTRQEGELAADFGQGEVQVEVVVGGEGAGADQGAVAGVEPEPGIRHLEDLMGGPRRLLTLRRGTVDATAGGDTSEARRYLLHVALSYRFAGYDLSQGTGELAAEVEYSLYNP